jgi:hypothetical protein
VLSEGNIHVVSGITQTHVETILALLLFKQLYQIPIVINNNENITKTQAGDITLLVKEVPHKIVHLQK